MRRALLVLTTAAVLLSAGTAAATPVATSEGEYGALGRVFPDPLAGCQRSPGAEQEGQGCSPYAQGNVPAVQFVQLQEFIDAMEFMNTQGDEEGERPWSRYMEVLPLDGKKGDGSGTEPGDAMFPGNNLPELEFTPDPKAVSAGLATTSGERKRSDLYVVRVTDENVPDEGKKRYALSLSIHGPTSRGACARSRTW
jgi:hypothetical protein